MYQAALVRLLGCVFFIALLGSPPVSAAGAAEPAENGSSGPTAPLVLVPGLYGSKLCSRDTGEEILGGTIELPVPVSRLGLRPESSDDLEACGLFEEPVVTVFGVGLTKAPGYRSLILFLESIGYTTTPGKENSLYLFDYDWRRSNLVTAQELGSFIGEIEPAREIDIISHSMGGIVARLHIDQNANSHRVRKLITMGTPHWGAAEILRAAYEGPGTVVEWGTEGDVRLTAITWPSMLELFPSYPGCCFLGKVGQRVDPLNPGFWQRLQWLPSEMKSPSTVAGRRFLKILEDAQRIQTILHKPITGVKPYLLASSIFETPYSITARKDGIRLLDERRFRVGGDGTVPFSSASNNGNNDAQVYPADAKHVKIFDGKVSRRNLENILLDRAAPPVAVSNEIRLPPLQGYVRINFVDLDLGSDIWISGRPVSATLGFDYTAELRTGARKFLGQKRRSRLSELMKKYLFDRVSSVCAELEGGRVCLELDPESLSTQESGKDRRFVSGRFTGTAPETSGPLLISVRQSVLPLDISETVYVRE